MCNNVSLCIINIQLYTISVFGTTCTKSLIPPYRTQVNRSYFVFYFYLNLFS